MSYLRTGEEYNSAVVVINDAAATPKFADVFNSVASLLLLMPLLLFLLLLFATDNDNNYLYSAHKPKRRKRI